jgi:hypothetical protein
MKRRYKILLVLSGIWLFAMIVTLPELTAVWPERKVVRQTFNGYANALINQHFDEAYGYQSPEFQERVTLASFLQYQRDVQAKYGILKSGFSFELHRDNGRWTIFSSDGKEL